MHLVQKTRAVLLRCRLGTGESRRAFAVLLKKHREQKPVFDAMELMFRYSSTSTTDRYLSLCLRHVSECFECWKELHRRFGFWRPLEIKVLPPMEWHESADLELQAKFEAQALSIESVRKEMEQRARLQFSYDRGEYVKLGSAEVAEACRYMNERTQQVPGFPKSLAKYRPTVYVQ